MIITCIIKKNGLREYPTNGGNSNVISNIQSKAFVFDSVTIYNTKKKSPKK